MRKFLCFIIALFALYSTANAQSSFFIGYNVGTYFIPMRNLQNVAFEFNRNYGENVTTPMKISNIYKGVNIGFHVDLAGVGAEMDWSNKHTIDVAKRIDNNTERAIALRTRLNTLHTGVDYPFTKSFSMGVGLNFGLYRISKKDALTTDFDKAEYENFYEKADITSALTIYGMKSIFLVGGCGFMLKPYVEWYYIPGEMHYRTRRYSFRTTNIGITTAINLGSKSED